MASTAEASSHVSSSGLFRIEDETKSLDILGVNIATVKYPKAIAQGPIDIYKDFMWRNPTSDISEVPRIAVKEYELTWGQTVTNLLRIIQGMQSIASDSALDTYLSMYNAKPTGFNYNFPHLLKGGSNLRKIGNSWGKADDILGDIVSSLKQLPLLGGVIGAGADLIQTGEKLLGGITTGFGYEEAQQYQSTAAKTLDISFPLYNTYSTKTAFKNYCFCLLFALQNLKTRTSFMTYIPPKLYKISNSGYKGGIYMPVAVVSDFSVESIGTTRILKDYQIDGLTNDKIIIPEAYKVTISFKELLPQSSNILLGAMGGELVEVFSSDDSTITKIQDSSVGQAGQKLLNSTVDAVKKLI